MAPCLAGRNGCRLRACGDRVQPRSEDSCPQRKTRSLPSIRRRPNQSPSLPAPAFVPDDKTPVRFTKTFSRFHRGDVAGFPESYAQQLITKGVAVLWQPPQSRTVNEMVRK